MSDRELLELAAKAVGINGEFKEGLGLCPSELIERHKFYWNPLTDDGDALRLATRLNIDIMFFNGFQEVMCCGQGEADENIQEPYGEDIQAAVRRCIVRAAAEIGRAMS